MSHDRAGLSETERPFPFTRIAARAADSYPPPSAGRRDTAILHSHAGPFRCRPVHNGRRVRPCCSIIPPPETRRYRTPEGFPTGKQRESSSPPGDRTTAPRSVGPVGSTPWLRSHCVRAGAKRRATCLQRASRCLRRWGEMNSATVRLPCDVAHCLLKCPADMPRAVAWVTPVRLIDYSRTPEQGKRERTKKCGYRPGARIWLFCVRTSPVLRFQVTSWPRQLMGRPVFASMASK